MVTMASALTNCRSQIDELNTINNFVSDTEIKVWINDAVRDMARRTETILVFNTTLDATPTVAKYNLPPDVIRVHRVEYTPTNSNQIYPVQMSTYEELDQIWGINPTTQSSFPSVACCWGTPGNMTIQFYPVPSSTGIFNLYYYAMPVNLNTDGTDDSKSLNIPIGWDDMVVQYVSYRVKMKAMSTDWQAYKQLYDQNIEFLVDVTRQAHDQGRYIQTITGSVPEWLYSFSDE